MRPHAVITAQGPRPSHQDRAWTDGATRLIVADGMGGHESGEVAAQTARVRDEVAAWLRGPGWARLSEVGSRLMQVPLPADPPVEHQLAVALASLALHSRALMVLDEGWLNILSSILARYSLTGNTRPRVETPVCLEDVRGHLQRLANDCASRVALVRRAGGW
jgi:serine/threonine protein phosphatase PrpC